MLNLVMLILSNKKLIALDVIYIPTTVLLIIFTILLQKLLLLLHLQYYYCFLVQWTTQMVTILESRCPIFISMKPITTTTATTLNSYNNKIRQTQPNKYNTTTNSTLSTTTPTTPTRALSRSNSDYYYHFALTKPSCTPMIIGLTETAHSLQRQSTDDKNNDENENCTNPTQKTKMKTNYSINGLLISATKFSMMIKMMKAKKYLMKNFFFRIIFFQNPQFNLFSSFRLSFSQKSTQIIISYARYMYKKIKQMFKTINLILLFF